MKTLLIILLIMIANLSYSHQQDTIYINGLGSDSICKIRGHIPSDVMQGTLMYCPDRIVEYPDSTVKIIHDCNKYKTKCMRCGQTFDFEYPDQRIILWRK